MSFPRALAGIAVAALLAACAHTSPGDSWQGPALTDIHYFESEQLEIEELSGWEYSGRIAARNGNDGGQATIRWSREENTHKLELFGPFGGGAVRMEYGPHGASLRDGKENLYRRENAQALLDEVVGWRVPFSDLGYWLFGIASRAGPAEYQLDAEGNLSRLRQSGWEIEFSGYRDIGGRLMPGRIFASRMLPVNANEEDAREVMVRLASREWNES